MRFAQLNRDYWELRSGEEAHAANPDTFWIPDESLRNGLRVGQSAKLAFDIETEEEPGRPVIQGEKMWVIVSETGPGFYVGILDNQPASFEPSESVYLRFGAEIPFASQHVIDIANPPKEHADWQLDQTPEVRWYGRDDDA